VSFKVEDNDDTTSNPNFIASESIERINDADMHGKTAEYLQTLHIQHAGSFDGYPPSYYLPGVVLV
jgi:hypothetical protein